MADSHVLVRWLFDPRRLSREQSRLLDAAVSESQPVGISAVTILEIGHLVGDGRLNVRPGIVEFFESLRHNPALELLPITYEIALESSYLRILRDPADRAIVATARVHGLRLLTSDQRIAGANLVSVVD